MGRRPKRPVDGEWSLAQVMLEAGVSRAVARHLVDSGALEGPWSMRSVVEMRVAAALWRPDLSPTSRSAQGRDLTDAIQRVQFAVLRAGRAFDQPETGPDHLLLVVTDGPQANTVVPDAAAAAAALGAGGDLHREPVMVLPVGAWTHALRAAVQRPDPVRLSRVG